MNAKNPQQRVSSPSMSLIATSSLSPNESTRGDDIGFNTGKISRMINNPSAEGYLAAVKTSVVGSLPP